MRPGTARSALGLLREPAWVRALLGVLALSVLFVLLGQWQLQRRQDRDQRNARVVANYGARAVPLADLLPGPETPMPVARTWRPVTVRGVYEPAGMLLVRNRPLRGDGGYEVLVPLRTESGNRLVVDRGWLPAGRTGAGPDAVPPPPAGQVDLLLRLRPGQDAGGRRAPAGQLPAVDLELVARALGTGVYQGYGVLAQEAPRPGVAPTLLPRPDVDPGPHLAYALQWHGFALTAVAMLGVLAVREVERRRPDPAPTGSGTRIRHPDPRRPRRVSDEEAEDSAESPIWRPG